MFENGDIVLYRYEGGEWNMAKFYSEDDLNWQLIDIDQQLRYYYKDRVELRKAN